MGGVFNHINGNLYHYGANNPVRYIDPDGSFDAIDDTIKGFTLWFNAFSNPTDFNTLNEVSDFMNATPEFWLYALIGGLVAGEYAYCYTADPEFGETTDKIKKLYNKVTQNTGIDFFNFTYKFQDTPNISIKLNGVTISEENLFISSEYFSVLPISKNLYFTAQFSSSINIVFSNIENTTLDNLEMQFKFDFRF